MGAYDQIVGAVAYFAAHIPDQHRVGVVRHRLGKTCRGTKLVEWPAHGLFLDQGLLVALRFADQYRGILGAEQIEVAGK